MAGTVTTTENAVGTVKKVTFTWVSSAGGAADATTTNSYDGEIIAIFQIPDAGGTQPTNSYDVVVKDADNHDILLGLGADISNSANSYKAKKDGLGAVASSKLTLAVTNAGSAKGGSTILWIR
ncbi:MAG: hypothetical protein RJA55_598 [Acidobacteriota bacterium]|jgi:hypothetical protein